MFVNNEPSPECLPVKVPVPDNVIFAFAVILPPFNCKYLDVKLTPASCNPTDAFIVVPVIVPLRVS